MLDNNQVKILSEFNDDLDTVLATLLEYRDTIDELREEVERLTEELEDKK